MGSFSKTAKPSLELVTPSVAVIKDSGKNQLKRGSGDHLAHSCGVLQPGTMSGKT